MKLNNNLVTLSACRTGTGTYRKGEGIISLARGFIHAGVSGVLMSLWEVADRSASEFMYYFYDELSGGSSRSQEKPDHQNLLITIGIISLLFIISLSPACFTIDDAHPEYNR